MQAGTRGDRRRLAAAPPLDAEGRCRVKGCPLRVLAGAAALAGAPLGQFRLGGCQGSPVIIVTMLGDLAADVAEKVVGAIPAKPLADALVGGPHVPRDAQVGDGRGIGHREVLPVPGTGGRRDKPIARSAVPEIHCLYSVLTGRGAVADFHLCR